MKFDIHNGNVFFGIFRLLNMENKLIDIIFLCRNFSKRYQSDNAVQQCSQILHMTQV